MLHILFTLAIGYAAPSNPISPTRFAAEIIKCAHGDDSRDLILIVGDSARDIRRVTRAICRRVEADDQAYIKLSRRRTRSNVHACDDELRVNQLGPYAARALAARLNLSLPASGLAIIDGHLRDDPGGARSFFLAASELSWGLEGPGRRVIVGMTTAQKKQIGITRGPRVFNLPPLRK